ncbi:hypothetical protein PC112_g22939 [Phytophthora cactorum]|nr:hypothetical protein PC112_g22939 [Phytophthora cactorum]
MEMLSLKKTSASEPKVKPVPQTDQPVTKNTARFVSKRELERARDRKRRKSYRELRRLEREILEFQVKELSAKFCTMTQPRQASCSLSAAAWRTIAEQQLEALQLAELLQKRLKLAVESRSRLIREMHQRLGSKESLSKHVNLNKHKRVQLGSSDVDILETYLRGIDAVYAQTDPVFQTLPVESASRNPDSNWPFDAATGFFTFADRRNIPFDFKLASQISWQLAHTLLCKEDWMLYERPEDSSNTIVFKLRLTRRMYCGRSVSVVQSMVGRRYCEKNRVVVVCRSFTEGEGLFRGMHSDETGWCSTQPLGNPRKAGTLLVISICHEPIHTEGNDPGKEQFTRLLHTMGSEEFVEITSSLENHLSNQVLC